MSFIMIVLNGIYPPQLMSPLTFLVLEAITIFVECLLMYVFSILFDWEISRTKLLGCVAVANVVTACIGVLAFQLMGLWNW